MTGIKQLESIAEIPPGATIYVPVELAEQAIKSPAGKVILVGKAPLSLWRSAMVTGGRVSVISSLEKALPIPATRTSTAPLLLEARESRGTPVKKGAGKLITLFSAESSVGKTVITANAGVLFNDKIHKRVCMVDADPEKAMLSFFAFGKRGAAIPWEPARSVWGMDVVPCKEGEDIPPDVAVRMVNDLTSKYDVVLVDTPGRFHLPAYLKIFLECSDTVMLVGRPEISVLANIKNFMEGGMLDPKKVVFVLNRVYPRAPLKPSEVQNALGLSVDFTLPEEEVFKRYRLGEEIRMLRSGGRLIKKLFRKRIEPIVLADSIHKMISELTERKVF